MHREKITPVTASLITSLVNVLMFYLIMCIHSYMAGRRLHGILQIVCKHSLYWIGLSSQCGITTWLKGQHGEAKSKHLFYSYYTIIWWVTCGDTYYYLSWTYKIKCSQETNNRIFWMKLQTKWWLVILGQSLKIHRWVHYITPTAWPKCKVLGILKHKPLKKLKSKIKE